MEEVEEVGEVGASLAEGEDYTDDVAFDKVARS